jgi:2-polyprenyl-3-methyl-5-hydroxy-6-metoxy-1,4-benzoquinol methylase
MFTAPGIWPLRQCSNLDCGLCWLDPSPVESDIPLFYTNYFTHEHRDPRQRFLHRLYFVLHGGYMLASYIPSAMLGLNKARHQMRHMFLEDIKPGKLLDVGCGNGVFLHRLHGLGWSVTGIDFDPKAIENCKKLYGADLTFINTDLLGARFPDNSFDAVTMSHVIEHVPDPVGLLIETRRILKTGGRLVITTPNIRSFGHEKFRDCWSGLDSPRHLQVFSLPTLQMCARKAGFDVMKASSSAANADCFIGLSFGFKEVKENASRPTGIGIRFNFVRGLHSLMLQYAELRQLRLDAERGEEAILICQK